VNIAPDDRKLVSIEQARRIAGVTRRTIYNWLALGKVDYTRTAGGRVRIYAETLFAPAPRRHDVGGLS
jgi:excisionase family DNA binding protein